MKKTILNLFIIFTTYTLQGGSPPDLEAIAVPTRPTKQNRACTICSFTTQRPSHLVKHIRTHTGEKPFLCLWNEDGKQCNFRSATKHTLNKHTRTHTGEKPYICDMVINGEKCETGFTQQGTYRRHQEEHNGKKNHACTECGKYFKRESHLKTHQFSHSKERPYKCIPCNKSFKRPKDLKEHTNKQTHKTAVEKQLLLAVINPQPTLSIQTPQVLPLLLPSNAQHYRDSETAIEKLIDATLGTTTDEP